MELSREHQQMLDEQIAEREKALKVNQYDKREIKNIHNSLKQKAKNLARIKGANRSALEYEKDLLQKRLDEIDRLEQESADAKFCESEHV